MDDLIKSGTGAIIGFTLAQFVNLVTFFANRLTAPKLKIETLNAQCSIFSDSTEINANLSVKEVYYGFNVRNCGRRIASKVRFQIIKMEFRDNGKGFSTIAESAFDLSTYHGSLRDRGEREVTILPNSAVTVALAYWRNDQGYIKPLIEEMPDYYDETCPDTGEYRFTVAAFEERAKFVTAVLTVKAQRV